MINVIWCKKCEMRGYIEWKFRKIFCIECNGKGFFTLEHLKQVRAGRSVKRLRLRYWLQISDVVNLFGLKFQDWRRIEAGNFSEKYTKDIYKALKRYTDSLEKLPFYTLVENCKGRHKFKEILTSFNRDLCERKAAELALKQYHIVTQETYVEKLK